jgi:flavodoxin
VKTLLIVCHSRTGGTRQMAAAAAGGAAAAAPDVHVRLLAAASTSSGPAWAADGCLFAMPENLGSMAGAMKDFFDRAYYPVLDRIAGRPYGVLICAGSDGQGAARQMARIATGWRLRAIADPLIVLTHAQTPPAILAPKTIAPPDLQRCATLGATLAAGLALGMF